MNFNHFFVVLTFVLCPFATALQRQTCVRELQYSHNGRCCNLCPPEAKTPCRNNQNRVCQCMKGYYIPLGHTTIKHSVQAMCTWDVLKQRDFKAEVQAMD
ncbi:Hypp6066 [Branchiostoma lanceolatum]|uniref:Hypp6066 protein n=1 Tax=Branchiostoma lanceolatum TaxID=7740 RepID=A0A8J9YNI9_BRALA|nr:Hypp6066 [Branchiostoma lanceolatum]